MKKFLFFSFLITVTLSCFAGDFMTYTPGSGCAEIMPNTWYYQRNLYCELAYEDGKKTKEIIIVGCDEKAREFISKEDAISSFEFNFGKEENKEREGVIAFFWRYNKKIKKCNIDAMIWFIHEPGIYNYEILFFDGGKVVDSFYFEYNQMWPLMKELQIGNGFDIKSLYSLKKKGTKK